MLAHTVLFVMLAATPDTGLTANNNAVATTPSTDSDKSTPGVRREEDTLKLVIELAQTLSKMSQTPGTPTDPKITATLEAELSEIAKLLQNDDERVRSHAIMLLKLASSAYRKEQPALLKPIEPTLVAVVKNKGEGWWIRSVATDILGDLRPASGEAILALKEMVQESNVAHHSIFGALARQVAANPTCEEPFIVTLGGDDSKLRGQMVAALDFIDSPSDRLLAACLDYTKTSRETAVGSVLQYLQSHWEVQPIQDEFIGTVQRIVEDTERDAFTRSIAAQSAGKILKSANAPDLERTCISIIENESENTSIRSTLLQLLAHANVSDADRLTERYINDPDPKIAKAARRGKKMLDTSNGDWQTIFDGKSLDGWTTPEGKQSNIPVQDGTINPHGCGGYMMTYKEPLEDFVLTCDFKISPKCNSGIFVRTFPLTPLPGKDVGWNGIEVAIDDTTEAGYVDTGAIYDLSKPTKNNMRPVGEWNHIEITCKGPVISVVLNGEKVNEVDLSKFTEPNKRPDGTQHKFDHPFNTHPAKGYIGLQDHGSNCWYKKIKLKRMG